MENFNKYNSQRHYEIYIFTADKDMDEELIRQWAEEDPQSFANTIRKTHSLKIFDGRATRKARIV